MDGAARAVHRGGRTTGVSRIGRLSSSGRAHVKRTVARAAAPLSTRRHSRIDLDAVSFEGSAPVAPACRLRKLGTGIGTGLSAPSRIEMDGSGAETPLSSVMDLSRQTFKTGEVV